MKTSTKVIITTVVFAVAAFMLAQVIWPNPEGSPELTSSQVTALMIVAALEAVALGIGMAFLFFAWPAFRNMADRTGAVIWFASIFWLLVSWYPHDNLHRVIGENINDLIVVEYLFHVTLYAAGAFIAFYTVRILKEKSQQLLTSGR